MHTTTLDDNAVTGPSTHDLGRRPAHRAARRAAPPTAAADRGTRGGRHPAHRDVLHAHPTQSRPTRTSPARGVPVPVPVAPAPGAHHAVRSEALVGRVVVEHGSAMRAYARWLCGDADTAQDLVQEALLRAWKHADRLDPENGSVRGWLITVLRNLDVDRRRAVGARPPETAVTEQNPLENRADPTSTTSLRAVEDRAVVLELLQRLAPADRDVLVRLHLHDESVSQAARHLGVPPGTVKSRSFYALRRLRALCERDEAALVQP